MSRLEEKDRQVCPVGNNWAFGRCEDLGVGGRSWEGRGLQSLHHFRVQGSAFPEASSAQRSPRAQDKDFHTAMPRRALCRGVCKEPINNLGKCLEAA